MNTPVALQRMMSSAVIEELDHVLKDWRYHFENDYLMVSTTDLNRLFIAVLSRIRAQFPDFMSSLEREWGPFEFNLLHHKTSLKIVPKVAMSFYND